MKIFTKISGICFFFLIGLSSPSAISGSTGKSKPLGIKMNVRGIKIHQGSPVVLLQTSSGRKLLPIWIGRREAEAIQLRLDRGTTPRPLTHRMVETMLLVLGAKIVRVEIGDLRDNVFYGFLTLRDHQGKLHRIDGRPSDFITLAVGAKLPIFVAPHVLKKAGFDATPPEEPDSSAPSEEI